MQCVFRDRIWQGVLGLQRYSVQSWRQDQSAVLLKLLYPVISGWIEKIPMKIGKILTWILIVFMCCNMIVSIMALVRSDQRAHDVKATYSWQQTMDERFDDARLQRIYPNALKVE